MASIIGRVRPRTASSSGAGVCRYVENHFPKKKARSFDRAFRRISLTMSYFHTGIRTIIGAEAFHCPVRDGKEWDHLAMVIRLNWLPICQGQTREFIESISRLRQLGITLRLELSNHHRQSYRVKPHEQLVLVSLTGYPASTPSLSTSWSRTTLQGAQGPGKTHLETSFPLRCFQRLSLPHIATRQCHWRDNRYTRGASTPVLSY
jgi:hypothetical protein